MRSLSCLTHKLRGKRTQSKSLFDALAGFFLPRTLRLIRHTSRILDRAVRNQKRHHPNRCYWRTALMTRKANESFTTPLSAGGSMSQFFGSIFSD